MARISRKCYNANYYHVMVQGIKREYIFQKEEYKIQYINFLIEACQRFSVKILSYCIMDNHAHILVFVSEINNLSKVMASTNTKFAIYYNKTSNRVGYVFRDRYRCENIYTQRYLENCIRYIHHNPVAAGICKTEKQYRYSTYNQFIKKEGIIDDEIITLCYGDTTKYLEKIHNKNLEFDFMDIDNEFNERKYEEVGAVYKEKIIGIDISKLNDIEKTKIGKEILARCKITKKDVAELLKINRIKFTRMLEKI